MPDFSSFRADLNASPDDRDNRLVLADALESEETEDPRGAVLRHACAIRQKIGSIAFPDQVPGTAFWTESEGWAVVGTELEALAAAPEDTPAFRERYNRLVRGDVPLDPEQLEATLRLQYDLQVRLLESSGLLSGAKDNYFITAVDNKRYSLPTFDDIHAKMQTPELRTKMTQGFDTLLLVPFGMDLKWFIEAWADGLRKNQPYVQTLASLFDEEPVHLGRECRDFVYDPRDSTRKHGGLTKEQIFATDKRGWDVQLVEGSLINLPLEAEEAQSIGGRVQIECGLTVGQYRTELRERKEIGQTPEGYVVQFLDALERKQRVLDTEGYSFLTRVFSTSFGTPTARWSEEANGCDLFNQHWGDDAGEWGYGVRAAVRVM